MAKYKVELFSIDRKDDSKDIQFITKVEATDRDNAVDQAKEIQKKQHPDINPADNWCWITTEIAE